MSTYLIAISLSIFINFCAVAMEPEEKAENPNFYERRASSPADRRAQLIDALRNADIEEIKLILTDDREYRKRELQNNFLPAKIAYHAYRNYPLDFTARIYAALPKSISPQDFDNILLELAKTNRKKPRNKMIMETKIAFDRAVSAGDMNTIIKLLSHKNDALFRVYLPAQMAFGVYRAEILGVIYTSDDLPGTISPQQLEAVLVSLAKLSNNRKFLALHQSKDKFTNLDEFTIDATGHYIMSLPSSVVLSDEDSSSSD